MNVWEAGDPYERYIGRWSRAVAQRFVPWLGVPPGRRWLDVAMGRAHEPHFATCSAAYQWHQTARSR